MTSTSFFLLLSTFGGCASHVSRNQTKDVILKKINIKRLHELNSQGLYGPPDGLRALSYEFCIPREQKYVDEIKRIDKSVKISLHSSGRIGCTDKQYLCLDRHTRST